MSTIGIVLAAGKGTRMNHAEVPKVLVPLNGKPLIGHVLETLSLVGLDRIIVVVGYRREQVLEYLRKWFPVVEHVIQEPQRGTAHAVMQAAPVITEMPATLLIVNGDVPLVRSSTLRDFLAHHRQSRTALSVLTTTVPAPEGYGRVIRSSDGMLEAIVEEADLLPNQRAIDEINTGIYAADAEHLFVALQSIEDNNVQGEYYLTDAVALLRRVGKSVSAWRSDEWQQFLGVNTPEQLRQLEDQIVRNEPLHSTQA
ncbi:MAG: NTP transferase domain-containing protein [Chlorobi bacterium]|nr:NTP transferase domain-containing protein [Chlorobiota bacterium]